MQQVCEKFLYTGRSVNNKQLHVLNKLSIKGTTVTEEAQEAQIQFLNYCASNPDAMITYRVSDINLN